MTLTTPTKTSRPFRTSSTLILAHFVWLTIQTTQVILLQALVQSLYASDVYPWSHMAFWGVLYQPGISLHGLFLHCI